MNERFYFSKPAPVQTKAATPPGTPEPIEEPSPAPGSAPQPELATLKVEPVEPVSQVSIPSADEDTASELESTHINLPSAAGPAVIDEAAEPHAEDEHDSIPGSWPRDESVINTSAPEQYDSDAASNHVNDRIADHFAQLERDQQNAVIHQELGDITTNGMSHTTVTNLSRGPIIVNHTELTPILESASPRESMGSDAELYIAPRLMSLKNRPNEEQAVYGSRPATGHSHSSSRGSPAVSVHSGERARSTSLTSQAERLRNKLINRKISPEGDLTLDMSPSKSERRMKYESLIRSGETMKMSLTPTSLRFIEVFIAVVFADFRMIWAGMNNGLSRPKFANKPVRILRESWLISSAPPARNHS